MGNKITNRYAKEFFVVFEKECQDKNTKKMVVSTLEKMKENDEFKLMLANVPLHIKGSSSLVKTLQSSTRILENLVEMSLKNTIFDSNCITSMCELLKKAKQLKSLDFSENDHLTTSKKTLEIIATLSSIPSLTSVNMSQMELDDEMTQELVKNMTSLKSIANLDLSGNKISKESLPAIKKFVSSVLSVQNLHLHDNLIEEKEVNMLKEILNNNPKKDYRTLHLSNSNNGDKPRISTGINTLDLEMPDPNRKNSKKKSNPPKNDTNKSDDNKNTNKDNNTTNNNNTTDNNTTNNNSPQENNQNNQKVDSNKTDKTNDNTVNSNDQKIEENNTNKNGTENTIDQNNTTIDNRDRGRTMIGMVQRVVKDPNFKEKLKEVPFSKSKRFHFGSSDTVGNRPTMEDVTLCMGNFRDKEDEDLFAVFDGHGSIEAALHVAKNFPLVFKEELEKNEDDIELCLDNTFRIVNENMKWAETTGCTAAVVFIQGKKLYSANCGDARTVICEDRKGIRLSFDHKPNLPHEVERINNLGGFIDNGRVQGILAVSRAFGDYKLYPYVISTPYIKSFDLSDLSTHLVIACDGVWDVLPDQMVASLVKNQGDPVKSSKLLKDRALASGSNDNISVIVIQLHPLLGQKPIEEETSNTSSPKNNKKNNKNGDTDGFFDSEDDDNNKDDNKDDKSQSDDSVVIGGDDDLDSEEIMRQLEETKQKNLKELEEGKLWI